MTRMFSSRATMAAGTRPPRVIATIALNGPSPFRRQASARESRWNWSHDTGNIFSGGGGSAAFLLMLSPDPTVLAQRLGHFVGRRPSELFIQRSRHAGGVQRHEADAAPLEFGVRHVHQHFRDPHAAMRRLDEHVRDITALVLSGM